MKSQFTIAVAAIACLGMVGCGKGQPKGQVVATVGKDEVTVLELQSALQGFRPPNAQIRKAAEQQALSSIIQRKILAQEAHKRKLDKTPEFARAKEGTVEALLVRTWQDQLVKAVPAPRVEDAQKFIATHPDIYAERKRFTIDAIRFNAPNDPSLAKALQPLNTLEDVRALLTARQIQFANGVSEIDAFGVDPRFVEQLAKLKPGEVFVVPQNNVVLVGQITGSRVDPVANDLAIRHATEYLRQTRVQQAVSRQFGSVVGAAMKNDVKFAKGYGPEKPPAKATPSKAPAKPAPTATKPG